MKSTLGLTLCVGSSTLAAALVYLVVISGQSEREDDIFESGQEKLEDYGDCEDTKKQYHVPYHHQRLSMAAIRRRSRNLASLCRQRRTLRFFSADPVPRDVIQNIIEVATTAPSGAHRQPWTFVAVQNQNLKQNIRELVEEQENLNYQKRMKSSWVDDVRDMVKGVHSTDDVHKPYLTDAPWIIVVLKQTYGLDAESKRLDHYYVSESVGIASGMLCLAIHNANLVTLTSTPMGSDKGIRRLLGRPENEKVALLMPVGFPANNATVPFRQSQRKPLEETIVWK